LQYFSLLKLFFYFSISVKSLQNYIFNKYFSFFIALIIELKRCVRKWKHPTKWEIKLRQGNWTRFKRFTKMSQNDRWSYDANSFCWQVVSIEL
jgi:hypothetical protein